MTLTPELQNFLDEALTLEPIPGDHLHPADGFMADPPPPGHRDWLPIIDALTEELVKTGDRWAIVFRLGTTDAFVRPPDTLDELFALADAGELSEPPFVCRIGEDRQSPSSEGEFALLRRRISPAIMAVFAITRSVRNREDGDPYRVLIYRELNFGDGT